MLHFLGGVLPTSPEDTVKDLLAQVEQNK
jgi:hypothetical protein